MKYVVIWVIYSVVLSPKTAILDQYTGQITPKGYTAEDINIVIKRDTLVKIFDNSMDAKWFYLNGLRHSAVETIALDSIHVNSWRK